MYKFLILKLLLTFLNIEKILTTSGVCTIQQRWPVTRRQLYLPDLNEFSQVLTTQLGRNFRYVNVTIEECPDLRNEPYMLANQGFGGSARLLDVGSLSNLVPVLNRSKIYDLGDLVHLAEMQDAYVFGAGAAPWPDIGTNGEGIYNYNYRQCILHQHSEAAIVDQASPMGYSLIDLPPNSRVLAITAALFASLGLPSNIVRVRLQERTNTSFEITEGLRSILGTHYGPQRVLGMGVIFVMTQGTGYIQIMPNFSETPLVGDGAFARWVSYFNMSAPLVVFGTIVTNDMGLHLYTPHFHLKSGHGQGGHWHYDVTPDIVDYDILINFGEYLYRIDQPTSST